MVGIEKMKLLIYFLSLFPALAQLDLGDPVRLASLSKPAAAATCSTLLEGNVQAGDASTDFGYQAGNKYIASSIIITNNQNACRIRVDLYKLGSPTFLITASIWSHDNTNGPGSQIVAAAATLDSSTISTDVADNPYYFDINSTALTDKSTNWIVLSVNTISGSSSHKVYWRRNNVSNGDKKTYWSTNGVEWVNQADRLSKSYLYGL